MASVRGIKKVLTFIALFILSLFFTNQAVFATESISISISPTCAAMNAVPETFVSTSQTLTISTTNTSGYVVNLSPTGSTNALINQSDPSISIPTFTLTGNSESLPAGSTGYGYGYSIDGGLNYFPVPAPSTSQQIFETNSGGENNHTLTFGALIPIEKPQGSYANSVNIQVVAKMELCQPDKICYSGNGDDETGTMSDQSATSNAENMLTPPNYSRPGYGFAGWNTSEDGTGTNYGPSETITTGDLSTEGLQLYAKWVPSAGNLQNWNGCDSLNPGDVTALTDTRDGSTYAVAKYADNQCWMMENLRLDLSNSNLEISAINTNAPTSSFATTIDNDHPASTNTFCTAENATCINQILYNTNNTNRNLTPSYDANDNSSSWYSYGNYYNWYTATAGNGVFSTSTAGAPTEGDICPAGWRLPSGYGSSSNLVKLDKAMGGTGGNTDPGTAAGIAASKRWRAYPLNFVLSGEQRGNTGYNRSTADSYATLNTANTQKAINLWIRSNAASMNSNSTSKTRGQTIRCIINESYTEIGNIHYDANGGTGTMADVTNVDLGTAVAANNEFTKQNAYFVGWNTSASGNGIVVLEGGSVAAAANHMGIAEGGTLTLYATWRYQYHLVYDGNGSDAGSMSSVNVNPLEAGNLTLVASNFSRDGYGFAGWSLDSDAGTKIMNGQSATIYGPNEKISVNSSFLSHADADNKISLYAVWIPQNTTKTMQTFTSSDCSAMSTDSITALKDIRDNNVYTIAKLKDGNCWMAENLRLIPSATALDDSNTNLPTTDFTTAAASSTSADTLCKENTTGCVDTIRFNANAINHGLPASHNSTNSNTSWYSYGVMYNWYTATAGRGTLSETSGNVTGDICPAGWRLPTGGSSGEYAALNTQINNGSSSTDAGLVKFPADFIYAGDYNYNKPGGRNNYGRYWSATPNGVNNAYRLGVTAAGATPTGSYNKWDAFAIRCIVKQ